MLWLFGLLLCLPVFGEAISAQSNLGITFLDDSALPVLTLPYATYQAHSYDSDKDIYIFRNIRYAAPPVGNLRWAPPNDPLVEIGVQDGNIGGSCFQSTPHQLAFAQPPLNLAFPQTEDCLFLDVCAPGSAVRNSLSSNLPVLFWIYGGGFVIGSKDQYGGESLLEISNNSIIYVQINYRLGAFGFLAGSKFQDEGGVANVGLLDQIAALTWAKKYIGYLGGDPNKITVMGQSAGGSSIMHHITAKGGTVTPIFNRAIVQSPAFFPQYDNNQLDTQFASFATSAGCPSASLSCLRNLSSDKLQSANLAETSKAPYGHFQYGPAIDGIYVQDLPGRELLNGRYAKDVQFVIAHNSDEGWLFTDPLLITDMQATDWINQNFPNATDSVKQQIEAYYPPPIEALSRYSTEFGRVENIIADALVICNCVYLAHAFSNNTFDYRFSVPPGIHALDLLYTFYPTTITLHGEPITLPVPLPYAQGLQSYLVSFIKHGDPNVERRQGTVEWPFFGDKDNIVDITLSGFSVVTDNEISEERCNFWQSAPYTGVQRPGDQFKVQDDDAIKTDRDEL